MPTLHRTSGQANRTTKTLDGNRVHISVWTDAPGTEYDGRLELYYPDRAERWAFGVHDGRQAEFLATNAIAGVVTDPEFPAWVQEMIRVVELEVAE
jgi:hypothetical protein